MAKRGFLKAKKNVKDNAERVLGELMTRAGGLEVAAPLCRKNDGARGKYVHRRLGASTMVPPRSPS